MLEKEYGELGRYLEEMIEDGVQLVHAGLMDWEDTKIPQPSFALVSGGRA